MRMMTGSAVVAAFSAQQTPAQLAALRRQLDDAEAFATTHGLSEGLAFVKLNRAALWIASDLERARTASEAALAHYRQLGLANSLEGIATRMIHLAALALRGDDEELRREVEAALRSGNYTRACSASTIIAVHEYQRADLDGLTLAVERFRRLAGADPSQIAIDLQLAELQLLVVRGEANEALAFVARHEPALRAVGAHLQGMRFTLWNVAAVEAALLLAEAGQLSTAERTRALRRARRLTTNGVLQMSAFGLRARAIFAHLDGDSSRARQLALQLLDDTSTSGGPYVRSCCVETACALGVASEEVKAEATTLRERYGYKRPQLRSSTSLTMQTRGHGVPG
jgi:hypothetical protein